MNTDYLEDALRLARNIIEEYELAGIQNASTLVNQYVRLADLLKDKDYENRFLSLLIRYGTLVVNRDYSEEINLYPDEWHSACVKYNHIRNFRDIEKESWIVENIIAGIDAGRGDTFYRDEFYRWINKLSTGDFRTILTTRNNALSTRSTLLRRRGTFGTENASLQIGYTEVLLANICDVIYDFAYTFTNRISREESRPDERGLSKFDFVVKWTSLLWWLYLLWFGVKHALRWILAKRKRKIWAGIAFIASILCSIFRDEIKAIITSVYSYLKGFF